MLTKNWKKNSLNVVLLNLHNNTVIMSRGNPNIPDMYKDTDVVFGTNGFKMTNYDYRYLPTLSIGILFKDVLDINRNNLTTWGNDTYHSISFYYRDGCGNYQDAKIVSTNKEKLSNIIDKILEGKNKANANIDLMLGIN